MSFSGTGRKRNDPIQTFGRIHREATKSMVEIDYTSIEKRVGAMMKKPECKSYPLKVIALIKELRHDNEAFKKSFFSNVEITVDGDRHRYECRKGLWVVSGPDDKLARGEALNYFAQYYNDGEYDE